MDILRRRTRTHDTADSTYGSATPSFEIPNRSNERGTFNSIRDTLSMLTRPSATKTFRTTARVVPTHFDRTSRARPDTLSFTQSTVTASSSSRPTTTPSTAASSTTSDVPSLTPTMNGPATPKPGVTNHSSSYVEPPLHQTRTARSHIRTIEGMRIFNQEVEDAVIARFNAISDTVQPALIQNLRKGRHEFRPLGIQLLVLGCSEHDARPWIVVLCPEPVKKRVTIFFQEDFARRVCSANGPDEISFEVAVVGRPLRPTASEGPIQIFGETQPLDSHVLWRPRIGLTHSGKSHYARVGGFVCARDARGTSTVYGLTAGHILPPETMGSLSGDHVSRNPDFDSSEGSHSRRSSGARSYSALEDYPASNGSTSSLAWTNARDPDWLCLGTVSEVSYSVRARNRDWALVRLSEQPGDMSRGSELDLNLHYKAATPAEGEDVLLYDGSFNTGKLSRLPARALLPYAYDFVPVYVLDSAERSGMLRPFVPVL
jgi:hypothetical protein